MKYFAIKAESAGDFGVNTVFEKSNSGPPRVLQLHYELDVWPSDELIQAANVFLVSEALSKRLEALTPVITGANFDNLEISTSARFEAWHSQIGLETYKDKTHLPRYRWLKVSGMAGHEDIGVAKELLVVSVRVYTAMRMHKINNCKVRDW